MAETQRNSRVCKNCQAPRAGDFKKVATLQNSGLLIFAHKEKHTLEDNRTRQLKKEETFVLHNASDKELVRADYITEMSQYRTKCPHCRTIVQKVRSLLNEITNIQRNQVLGICEHCKHANPSGKCRRCEYIVNKFLCNKIKHYEDIHNRLKSWLTKMNQLLHFILERENVCKLYKDSSTVELQKLLQELKAPLEMRQPDVTFFPTEPDHINSMTQSKDIIDKLLIKLKSESLRKRSSDDSMHVSPSMTTCVCKYFMDSKVRPPIDFLNEVTLPVLESKLAFGDSVKKTPILSRDLPSKQNAKTKSSKEKTPGKEKVLPDENNDSPDKITNDIPSNKKSKTKSSKEKTSGKENVLPDENNDSPVKEINDILSNKKYNTKSSKEKTSGRENVLTDENNDSPAKEINDITLNKKSKTKSSEEKTSVKENFLPDEENYSPDKISKKKSEEKTTKEKTQKNKLSSEDKLFRQLLKKNTYKEMQIEIPVKKEKVKVFAKIDSLPQIIKRELIQVVNEISESTVECSHEDIHPPEMIRGDKVVKFDPRYALPEPESKPPLLFKRDVVFDESKIIKPTLLTVSTVEKGSKMKSTSDVQDTKGIIKYKLSDTTFVEKGWTILPKIKVMRRMNIYKMIPANPNNDWFKKHIKKEIMFYESGEKLAEIYHNGRGKWFYKNGMVALDYYKSQGTLILHKTNIKMNIYKMIPANPNNDWFKKHIKKEIMFYESGEKLAEIYHNGRGKWFYKNGMVALDYYKSQEDELGLGLRYVVYSSGEDVESVKSTPVTVLACFDFLGNGIIYDHYGNERLKYNQTEGTVIDEKIGPSSLWKWHSLNEPPNIQSVFIDSHVQNRNPCLDHLFAINKEDDFEASTTVNATNNEMLEIELENFAKAKARKLLQKYKPFQIKLKAFKVNDQFSLRILDQANIYLLFREGKVSLKLNLGMLLINSEIIDTDISEVSQVATPYDQQRPPKSKSIAEIQDILKNARRVGRTVKTSFRTKS